MVRLEMVDDIGFEFSMDFPNREVAEQFVQNRIDEGDLEPENYSLTLLPDDSYDPNVDEELN